MTGVRDILLALREKGPLSAIELTQRVAGWVTQTSRDLRILERQGYVRRLGDGKWQEAI